MSFGEELARQLDIVAQLTRPAGRQFKSAPDSARGVKARLGYILSPKTGASVDAVAKAAGVTPRTVRTWQAGGTPSKASKKKIDQVYQKFFGINERARHSKPRQKKRNQVLSQVRRNRLQLQNDRGDERYYTPSAGHWADFVDAWAEDNWDMIDAQWDGIVDDWDYGEAWESGLIYVVTIR